MMVSLKDFTPKRLERLHPLERHSLLKAHLSKFSLFPATAGQNSRQLLPTRACSRKARLRRYFSRSPVRDSFDLDKALRYSIGKYAHECDRLRRASEGLTTVNLVSIMEREQRYAFRVLRNRQAAFEAFNHEKVADDLEVFKSKLEMIRWRARVSRDSASSKSALREEKHLIAQAKHLLAEPLDLEADIAEAKCIVAQLGLLVRRFRASAAISTSCTLHSSERTDSSPSAEEDLRRALEKKLRKTKRVNFEPKGVRVRIGSTAGTETTQDLRGSVDQRRRSTFKRCSAVYRPGKWADQSGHGYIDTSGFKVGPLDSEATHCEPLSPRESLESLSVFIMDHRDSHEGMTVDFEEQQRVEYRRLSDELIATCEGTVPSISATRRLRSVVGMVRLVQAGDRQRDRTRGSV